MGDRKRHRAKARKRFWAEFSREEYQCPDCGRSSKSLRTGFEVHHRDGDASNNELENLVALCRPCHNLREDKKPSINEVRLIRDQLADDVSATPPTPLITDQEEANSHFRKCDRLCIPVFEIRQISRRKYATLQIDWISTEGWRKFIRPDENPREPESFFHPKATLTEEAAGAVNEVMASYENEKMPDGTPVSAPRINSGAGFMSYPPLLPDVCRELAAEVKPIVMDKTNWKPNCMGSLVAYTEAVTE